MLKSEPQYVRMGPYLEMIFKEVREVSGVALMQYILILLRGLDTDTHRGTTM